MTKTTRRRARRLSSTAALACCLAAVGGAPGASAQAPPTGVGPVDTIVNSLNGGVNSHAYNCEESRPEVQAMIKGVRESLKTIYPDYLSMLARGFAPYADAGLPALGFAGQGHWLNPKYINDGHIMDPRYPEGILIDKWNRPIGVMFIEDDYDIPGPDLYVAEDGTPCNAWHYHSETAADAYWYLYKYLWSGDPLEGDVEPPARTPDLMHVWAYGDYKYQWQHGEPPADQMPGDPRTVGEVLDAVGGPMPPDPLHLRDTELPPVGR